MGSKRTKYLLTHVTDYIGFEYFCHDLMVRHGYDDLEPLGGSKDEGRDAINVSKKSGVVTFFAYSVRVDWEQKLAEDLKKIANHGHPGDKVVFVTTQILTAGQKDAWIEKTKKTYCWDLEFYDLERIATFVDGPDVALKKLHPNIFFLDSEKSPSMTLTRNKATWVELPALVFEIPLRKAFEMGKFNEEAHNAYKLFRSYILQGTARAFADVAAVQTTVLFTCNINVRRFHVEIRSHRFTLLREIRYFFDLFGKDESEFHKQWDRFNSEWPTTKYSDLPLNATCFPLGISFIREARLIEFRSDLITSSIDLPETTDEFLRVIGTMINAQSPLIMYLSQAGSHGHPFYKLFCFVADHEGSVELQRLKVNPNNVDEFDYDYPEYDQ